MQVTWYLLHSPSGCNQKRLRVPEKRRNLPYLPIDPKDLGRDYDAVIIVSLVKAVSLTYWNQTTIATSFANRIQPSCSTIRWGTEINAKEIWTLFKDTYVKTNITQSNTTSYQTLTVHRTWCWCRGWNTTTSWRRPISAFLNALQLPIDVLNYVVLVQVQMPKH